MTDSERSIEIESSDESSALLPAAPPADETVGTGSFIAVSCSLLTLGGAPDCDCDFHDSTGNLIGAAGNAKTALPKQRNKTKGSRRMNKPSAGTYGNYINGEWSPAASGATYESRSPANSTDLVGTFASSDTDDLDRAISAAAEAASIWRGTSPIARANLLFKAAEILTSRVTDIGRELAWEEGKTAKEGIGETGRAAQILRYFAGDVQQPDGEHYPSANPSTLLYTVKEPLGAVGIITPWNFPIAIPAWKIAPALAYGNTVVFKPASLTPLLAVRFVEALAEAGLPPGVLNLVTGSSAKLGDPMVDDPRLTAISFTGSGISRSPDLPKSCRTRSQGPIGTRRQKPGNRFRRRRHRACPHSCRQWRHDEHWAKMHGYQSGNCRLDRSCRSSPKN